MNLMKEKRPEFNPNHSFLLQLMYLDVLCQISRGLNEKFWHLFSIDCGLLITPRFDEENQFFSIFEWYSMMNEIPNLLNWLNKV